MEKNDIHRDRALFSRIAAGEESAFEELFHIYQPQLYRIIYNLVPEEPVVKDLAQEVFLYLWLGREKLEEVEEPQHWIFRIAYNRSFKYLKRRQIQSVGLPADAETNLHTNDTEDAVSLAETIRLIREAVQSLPQQQQRIYQLNRNAGKKPAEIAEELHISVQAVRNSLTRSSKVIRDYLVERGIEIPIILILLYRL